MRGFLSFILLSLAPMILLADMPSVNPQARTKMMGGAGLAVRGSKDSPSVNPAGLADIEKSEIQIFPLTVEAPFNLDSISSFQDYKDVADKSASSTAEKQQAFDKFLNKVARESIGVRVNLNPSYTRKYFHVGIFLDAALDAQMRAGGFASNQMMEAGNSNVTAGAMIAGAYSFFDNRLQVGANLKPLYRAAPLADQNQRISEVLYGMNDDQKIKNQLVGDKPEERRSMGFGFDLGMKYWIRDLGLAPSFLTRTLELLKPAVGVTYQDVGNTHFFATSNSPRDINQSLSAGIALHPEFGFIRTAFALDFRNLTEEQDFLNTLHLGAEVTFWKFWSVRGGISQGYLTGGMGLALWKMELDAFVTAEEASEHAHTNDIRTFGARFSVKI